MLRLASRTGRQHRLRAELLKPLLAPTNVPTNERQNSHVNYAQCRTLAALGSASYISSATNPTQFSNHAWGTSTSMVSRRNFTSTRSTNFAAAPDGGGAYDTDTATTPSVDATLDQLFAKEEVAAAAESAMDTVWEPVWWNIADQACLSIKLLHDTVGFEFGWSIVGATLILRTFLFPILVFSQRTTSRMAHIQPELKQLQKRYEALGTPSRQDQMQFSENMKKLFGRYGVNPIYGFAAPAIQLPLFMGMFFGIRKMGTIYPDELANGGMLWFPDLTSPDPYYILPFLSASTMLVMMEMSKNEMAGGAGGAGGTMMLNFFRMTTILMFPVLTQFDSALVCYWTVNNTLTMSQTALLKTPYFRDVFGIWEKPKPVPGVVEEAPSLTEELKKVMKKINGEPTSEEHRIKTHNRAIRNKKKSMRMMSVAQQARGKTATRRRG